MGCVEVLICLEENTESLYGADPYECPPRPGEELNMAIFQGHIGRILSLIEDIKGGIEYVQYLLSWKRPSITVISLYFFVRIVVAFDPAYIGSFPLFLMILWMIYLGTKRIYGKQKQKFIQKEITASKKVSAQTFLLRRRCDCNVCCF